MVRELNVNLGILKKFSFQKMLTSATKNNCEGGLGGSFLQFSSQWAQVGSL